MKRLISTYLKNWLDSSDRKPLILRGARQVGKTWAVRELAKQSGRKLIEINFERDPELSSLFTTNDPKKIIYNLEAYFNLDIHVTDSILFLDEIQAASLLISKLRWFYEELPELPVIAAGSLLEFALSELDYSMPVGRVSYMFMNPMSYQEFLWAMGEDRLAESIEKAVDTFEIALPLHEKAKELFHQYCIVGGMPAAVKEYSQNRKLLQVNQIQLELLQTYMDDFNKYRKRIDSMLLRATMNGIVRQLGEKFTYTHVSRSEKSQDIKSALELLSLAGLCVKVYRTSANGVPLSAEEDRNTFKVIFLDTGLALNLLGFRPDGFSDFSEMLWVNKGAIAEQIVGQQLVSSISPNRGAVHYWQQMGSLNGEIDYVISNNMEVIPVEVKAGASGSMKSLHAFMEKKELKNAIRFDENPPSKFLVDLKTTQGKQVQYYLSSYSLYMSEFVFRRQVISCLI